MEGSSFLLYLNPQNFSFELPGAGKATQLVLTSKISLLKGRPEALDIPFRKEEESEVGVVGGIGKYDQ